MSATGDIAVLYEAVLLAAFESVVDVPVVAVPETVPLAGAV